MVLGSFSCFESAIDFAKERLPQTGQAMAGL
jgi:hypothetical protein